MREWCAVMGPRVWVREVQPPTVRAGRDYNALEGPARRAAVMGSAIGQRYRESAPP